MNRTFPIILLVVVALLTAGYFLFGRQSSENKDFISYQIDVQQLELCLYWKKENGDLFRSLGNLKDWSGTKRQQLIFAMNAGMFKVGNAPQGLFIQEGKTIMPLDTSNATGNFYLRPNGVFYVTADKKAFICTTEQFPNDSKVLYATQSGPMLVIGAQLHPAFKQGSANVHIRNGVGILPDGKVIFAMSKKEVNFYDFATYFRNLGCRNALYLDGLVSRAYVPEKNWIQTDGDFGVIIGVTKRL